MSAACAPDVGPDGSRKRDCSFLPPFSTFTFTADLPPRRIAIRDQNPFCALAARTPLGAGACARACGLTSHSAEAHTCPLGLELRRVAGTARGGVRWVGARFTSSAALHHALDLLERTGLDPDAILDQLPDEPIVSSDRLQRAADAAASPAEPSADPVEQRIVNVIEYIGQIHSLLAEATRPEEVCDRFLRTLVSATSFDKMAIYLWDPAQQALILAAAADREDPRRARPHAHPTHADPEGLLAQAYTRGRTLIERAGGEPEPICGEVDGPLRIAIPLPPRRGHGVGVWTAMRRTGAECLFSQQPIRLMHLLAEMLAARLEPVRLVQSSDPDAPPEPCDLARLHAMLRAEIARAARLAQPLALLHVRVESARAGTPLPLDPISRALQRALRPYDILAPRADLHGHWAIILPHTSGEEVQSVAERILMLLEDVMDRHGGSEELGMRYALGIATWSAGTSTAEALTEHAAAAIAHAPAAPGGTILYDEPARRAVGG